MEAYSGIHTKVLLMCKKPIQNPKSFPRFSKSENYNATDFHFYIKTKGHSSDILLLPTELLSTTVFWYYSMLLELIWTQYSVF